MVGIVNDMNRGCLEGHIIRRVWRRLVGAGDAVPALAL